MKDWKFLQVGNTKTGNYESSTQRPDSKIYQTIHEFIKTSGGDADKAFVAIKRKYPNLTDEFIEKSIDEVIRTNKAGNESIDKQEWSLYQGLKKDAEKEIGNETYQHKLYPDKYVIINGKNYKIITDGKVEKTGELTDAILYGINQTYKRVSSMNSKTVNQSAQDKFLDDINGIKAKYKQEGKEINLSRLMYELKRIGWAESDFTKLKWPANIGNASLGKFLMGGGHTATLVEGGGKFIVKYDDGRTETFMTRKAAEAFLKVHSELYIGNTAHSDKVEVIKKLIAGGWSVEDIYKMLKTEGYEVEKSFIERLKTGNETKAERKFGKVMGEFEEGALKTPQGKTVTDPAQAKAIAYSEADKVDNLKRARNAMNRKVTNSAVREYKDSEGRIAQIDFNEDGTDADMSIYEDERMTRAVESKNFSTIRDAEQYVQSHGFRRVG